VEAHVHDPETCCKAVQKLSLTDPKTLLGYKCYCKDRWGGPNCDMQAGDCTTDKCGTNGICVEGKIKTLWSEMFQFAVVILPENRHISNHSEFVKQSKFVDISIWQHESN
jgi:hypothetical protein